MAAKRARSRETFTIDEANAMLPLVRAIASDLAELSREVNERRERLSYLLDDRQSTAQDFYREELVQVQDELEKEERRLDDYKQELRALGLESPDGPHGYVDFPSTMDNRRIALCWRLGEAEVSHWHEVTGCCEKRKPLTSLAAAGVFFEADDSSSL